MISSLSFSDFYRLYHLFLEFVAYIFLILVGSVSYFWDSQPTFLLIWQDENVKTKKWSLPKDKKGRKKNKITIIWIFIWQMPEKQVYLTLRSRGDSGALYLQSATAGVIPIWGLFLVELPSISGVDVWVLRNRTLWTVSGQEWSSTKQNHLCAVRVPGPS